MEHRRVFWGLMIGLALGLMILVARHDEATIAGLGLDEFSALIIKVSLLVFLGGAALMLFRHRLTAALEAALVGLLIGLILAAGYTYRGELRQVADRMLAEVIPGRPAARGKTVVATTHDLACASQRFHQVLALNRAVIAYGPSDLALDADVLARAYGGQLLVLGGRTVVIDDAHHHDEPAPGERHFHEQGPD